MALDPALLDILACPNCDERPPLEQAEFERRATNEGVETDEWLRCTSCGRLYPVVDGIPHLLPESAVADNPTGVMDA